MEFFCLDISTHQHRNEKKWKYEVIGHVRIMYITNICIMIRPNASHVIVDICTIVVVFCVYQDEFLYLRCYESTPVYFLNAWSLRLVLSFKLFVDDWEKNRRLLL